MEDQSARKFFLHDRSDAGSDQLLTFLLLDPVTDNDFKTVADATITQLATALHGG